MDEATRICARLLREGSVPRAALPELDFPDVRHEVERRLEGVGLVLATSLFSEHVGIRLAPEVTADAAFDAATNPGLRSDACALLVILWAHLVLQKRTAAETREVPGPSTLDRAATEDRSESEAALEALSRGLISALEQLGGSAAMGDLARRTGAPASRLRRVLKELEATGRVRRSGERASARYHLVKALVEPAEG